MSLLCFRFPSSRRSDDDGLDSLASLDLSIGIDAPKARAHAEQPPPLSPTEINLFDTFPRIVFGGYRRYYESNADLKRPVYCREKTASSSAKDKEETWNWQNLPQFSGRRRRRRTSSTPSTHASSSTSSHDSSRPQLREKPRIRFSGGEPLVDLSYPWPDWLWPDPEAADPVSPEAEIESETVDEAQ